MVTATRTSRVLLVDDETIFRDFVRQALEGLGRVAVQEAGNGQEACHLLQADTEGFDLLVCDVFMPDMDGIELLGALARQHYRGKLTLVSGGNPTMLELARTFAVKSGLRLAGAFPKENLTPVLLQAILDFDKA